MKRIGLYILTVVISVVFVLFLIGTIVLQFSRTFHTLPMSVKENAVMISICGILFAGTVICFKKIGN